MNHKQLYLSFFLLNSFITLCASGVRIVSAQEQLETMRIVALKNQQRFSNRGETFVGRHFWAVVEAAYQARNLTATELSLDKVLQSRREKIKAAKASGEPGPHKDDLEYQAIRRSRALISWLQANQKIADQRALDLGRQAAEALSWKKKFKGLASSYSDQLEQERRPLAGQKRQRQLDETGDGT